MRVEVIYFPLEGPRFHHRAEVAPRATAGEVIQASGLLEQHPELSLESLSVGVYSRRVSLDSTVEPGDRVEVYRPLLCDPKESRRRRS